MEHGIYLIQEQDQSQAFEWLILPEIFDRLDEEAIFLIGAVEGNQPVGAAVMELEPGRAQLLSIAVAEDHRRLGIGSALLRQCVRLLRQVSIQTLYTVLTPEETEAAALFAAFGMEVSDESSAHYRFTLADALKQSALQGEHRKAVPLESVSDLLFREFLLETFPDDPEAMKREQLDQKISHVLIEDGHIAACVLFEREDDTLSLSWLSSQSQEKLAVLYLLRGAIAAAAENCAPETVIELTVFDQNMTQLVDRLIEQAEKISVQAWTLANGRFRLTDTTPAGWEVSETTQTES